MNYNPNNEMTAMVSRNMTQDGMVENVISAISRMSGVVAMAAGVVGIFVVLLP